MSDRVTYSLFRLPTWDGKIVLAGMFIAGYFLLVLRLTDRTLPKENIELVKDALLVLGPPIGLIFHALFRSTGAEERRDAMRSGDFRAALETPGPAAADIKEDVRKGAEEGSRAGVADGIDEAAAQPPANPDRVDRGRFPTLEPIVAPLDDSHLPEYARAGA